MGFFKDLFCGNELIWIKDLQLQIGSLENANKKMVVDVQNSSARLVESNKKIAGLKSELEILKNKVVEHPKKKYWTSKHPEAFVYYKCRTLPFSDYFISVPVNIFLTPQDPAIVKDLKKWGFLDSNESPETLIPKIYFKIRDVFYKYEFERVVWGKDEVWEFPYEMRQKGFRQGYDCDGWAIFQASYYLAAGVPEWMVRVVCGDSWGGGHATVYVYSDVTDKFHHLNCLEAGTQVLTETGYCNVEDITIGDKVLDKNGDFKKVVSNAVTNNKNKMYLRTSANPDNIGCTPEHRFLVVNKSTDGHWHRAGLKPEFKFVKDIKVRDSIVLPINDHENEISFEKDFIWLLGHYLGDGNIIWRNRKTVEFSGLRFIKSSKNKELIAEITNILSKYSDNKVSIIEKGETTVIYTYDTVLANRFVDLCSYSKNKALSSDLLFMKKELQKELLKGLISADGCVSKHRNKTVVTLVQSLGHKELINGVLFLLRRLRLEYNTSSRWNHKSSFHQNHKIASVQIRGLDLDSFEQEKLRGSLVQYVDNFALASVTQVIQSDEEDIFYEIEVEETHSYTAEGLACHNSTYGLVFEEVHKFPTHKDAEEKRDFMGIKNVWFSFTYSNAFYDFKSRKELEANFVINDKSDG